MEHGEEIQKSRALNSWYYKEGTFTECDQGLIVEEPLAIRIDGRPYSVVMRTPGEEIEHAAGFCLAEGLVESPDDILNIGLCDDEGSNVVTMTLTPERRKKVADLLERRGFVSQTSCGICGKELIADMQQILKPVETGLELTAEQAFYCVKQLEEHQRLYKNTRGAHAAMILDRDLEPMAMAEDVGRHNALDKAIGNVFMDRKVQKASVAVMSSRISYELVQKANRAGLAFMLGMSRPTALAVELADALHMTIASVKQDGLLVFSGKNRFIFPDAKKTGGYNE